LYLYFEHTQNFTILIKKQVLDYENQYRYVKNPIEIFVNYMNDLASDLKLYNTYYENPHGLPNKFNVSTAYD
jgi:hypothetical protein